MTLVYLNGPVDLDAGYQSVANASNSSTLRATFLGGSYNFGNVKAYAGFHNARQSDGSINKDVYKGYPLRTKFSHAEISGLARSFRRDLAVGNRVCLDGLFEQ
ncbi:MAG: hypothetical protein CBARDMAM_7250, partial [uncultured Caballeronia sp.]